jgi:UDP-N-acetylglucosamine 2-epimerase (non-hydrolysing)
LHLVDPLGYLEFVALMAVASAVVTDSGGVQEETSVLGVPCVTVRTSTERPVTCTLGTNRLVHPEDHAGLVSAVRQAGQTARRPAAIPLWDGHASERVVAALAEWASR